MDMNDEHGPASDALTDLEAVMRLRLPQRVQRGTWMVGVGADSVVDAIERLEAETRRGKVRTKQQHSNKRWKVRRALLDLGVADDVAAAATEPLREAQREAREAQREERGPLELAPSPDWPTAEIAAVPAAEVARVMGLEVALREGLRTISGLIGAAREEERSGTARSRRLHKNERYAMRKALQSQHGVSQIVALAALEPLREIQSAIRQQAELSDAERHAEGVVKQTWERLNGDDRRYRPDWVDPVLRGTGRATAQTAAAVKRGRTITNYEHRSSAGIRR